MNTINCTLIDNGVTPLLKRKLEQSMINMLYDSIDVNSVYDDGNILVKAKTLTSNNVELVLSISENLEQMINSKKSTLCYRTKVTNKNKEQPDVII